LTPFFRRKILALTACCVTLATIAPALALEPETSNDAAPQAQAITSTAGALPRDAYQTTTPVRETYSRLFRNTGTALRAETPPRTESVSARATVGLPMLNASIPLLQRGFEPQDADLKLGPLFFKLRELTGAVLWSDNINLSETRRESGVIAITSISGAVIAQVTEGLRLALAGSLVYLPLQNEAGVTGFGLFSPYVLGLNGQPLLRSEVTWNTVIGGWNVVFADVFFVTTGGSSANLRGDAVLFEGGGFDEVDRAGRYTFGANRPAVRRGGRGNDEQRADFDFLVFSNIVSARADRLITGKTRFSFRASHENFWFSPSGRGLPRDRDQINVRLASERENQRFKPYLEYSASRTNIQDSILQTLFAGVDGPITDQLLFHGGVGFLLGSNRNGMLWRMSLDHQAGPYTHESVFYNRNVNDFNDEISQTAGYNIQQILGPKVVADAFLVHSRIEALRRDGFSRNETRTGVRVRVQAGPRTEISLVGTGALVSSDFGDFQLYTGRAEIAHRFTETIRARLSYQYQQRDSDFRRDRYYENLVYFSVSKYFN